MSDELENANDARAPSTRNRKSTSRKERIAACVSARTVGPACRSSTPRRSTPRRAATAPRKREKPRPWSCAPLPLHFLRQPQQHRDRGASPSRGCAEMPSPSSPSGRGYLVSFFLSKIPPCFLGSVLSQCRSVTQRRALFLATASHFISGRDARKENPAPAL